MGESRYISPPPPLPTRRKKLLKNFYFYFSVDCKILQFLLLIVAKSSSKRWHNPYQLSIASVICLTSCCHSSTIKLKITPIIFYDVRYFEIKEVDNYYKLLKVTSVL